MKENERVSYEFTLRRAKEVGNEKAYAQLAKISPPPWNSLSGDRVHSKYLQEFGGGMMHKGGLIKQLIKPLITNGEYILFDIVKWIRGQMFSMNALKEELANIDFSQTVWEIKVPVLFCCGRHDYTAPSELAASYYKEFTAPYKRMIWFEQSAHSSPFEEKEKFINSVNDFVNHLQYSLAFR
jgi:pimeloyl-ACP methyl ester carboxylesterase